MSPGPRDGSIIYPMSSPKRFLRRRDASPSILDRASRPVRRARRQLLRAPIIVSAVMMGAVSCSVALGAHDVGESREHNAQSRQSKAATGKANLRRGLQRRGDPPSHSSEGGGNNDSWGESGNKSRWGDSNNDAANTDNSPNTGGNAYGDYGTYMGSGSSNGYDNAGGSGSGGGGGSTSSYGSYNNGDSWSNGGNSGGYDSYGSGSNSIGGSGSSSSYSTGGYDSYGSSSSGSTAGGYDSWSSTGSYGGDTGSYSSVWGANGGASSKSDFISNIHAPTMPEVNLSLIPAIFLLALSTLAGMLITAHRIENDPEGTFANCCRVSLHTVHCVYKVIYNLYHCRLGDIPQVVFASELEEDEYTEEEIERMRLRPGIERALDVEHRKALRKVGVEMGKIKVKEKKGSAQNESSGESMQR